MVCREATSEASNVVFCAKNGRHFSRPFFVLTARLFLGRFVGEKSSFNAYLVGCFCGKSGGIFPLFLGKGVLFGFLYKKKRKNFIEKPSYILAKKREICYNSIRKKK